MTTTDRTPWNPTPDADGHITLPEAVGQALGTASACWIGGTGPLEFDSAQCSEVYDGLMAYLDDWAHEQRKQANESTAAKMGIVVVNPLRIALERLAQAAEQYLLTDGDEARMLELRRKLGEASTDAAIVLYPPDGVHCPVVAGPCPGNEHGVQCSRPCTPAAADTEVS